MSIQKSNLLNLMSKNLVISLISMDLNSIRGDIEHLHNKKLIELFNISGVESYYITLKGLNLLGYNIDIDYYKKNIERAYIREKKLYKENRFKFLTYIYNNPGIAESEILKIFNKEMINIYNYGLENEIILGEKIYFISKNGCKCIKKERDLALIKRILFNKKRKLLTDLDVECLRYIHHKRYILKDESQFIELKNLIDMKFLRAVKHDKKTYYILDGEGYQVIGESHSKKSIETILKTIGYIKKDNKCINKIKHTKTLKISKKNVVEDKEKIKVKLFQKDIQYYMNGINNKTIKNHINLFKEGAYVIFDIEATSGNPSNAKIIEIAAIKIVNGKVIDTFQTLVSYKRVCVSKNIYNLTGITRKDLKTKGITLSKALDGFFLFIGDMPVVAHSIKNDWHGYLCNSCATIDKEMAKNKIIDSLTLFKYFYPNEKNGLDALIDRFNLNKENKDRHRALNDCYFLYDAINILLKIL